jgi:hypothetical protein
MPTLRRLLRRLIGIDRADSVDSGNLPTTEERVDQLTAELAYLDALAGSIAFEASAFSTSTRRAIAIHTSQIQDTANELRRITNELRKDDQTLSTQLEAFNRDAIARDVNLCVRIEVLEKLAAAAPSVFNLKPSEN